MMHLFGGEWLMLAELYSLGAGFNRLGRTSNITHLGVPCVEMALPALHVEIDDVSGCALLGRCSIGARPADRRGQCDAKTCSGQLSQQLPPTDLRVKVI
jgi:hypothetical protein